MHPKSSFSVPAKVIQRPCKGQVGDHRASRLPLTKTTNLRHEKSRRFLVPVMFSLAETAFWFSGATVTRTPDALRPAPGLDVAPRARSVRIEPPRRVAQAAGEVAASSPAEAGGAQEGHGPRQKGHRRARCGRSLPDA